MRLCVGIEHIADLVADLLADPDLARQLAEAGERFREAERARAEREAAEVGRRLRAAGRKPVAPVSEPEPLPPVPVAFAAGVLVGAVLVTAVVGRALR